MQASRASQETPGFKIFYGAVKTRGRACRFEFDQGVSKINTDDGAKPEWVRSLRGGYLLAPAVCWCQGAPDAFDTGAPSVFYAPFSRTCFTALRSEIASASGSLEKSSLRNASMIVSLGIARLLHRVITLASVKVPSRTFALMAWYKNSLLLFISDSSIDMALPPS